MFHKKKSLGQNFLRSQKTLEKIVATADVQSSDFVLEVGPGEGALTTTLLGTGAQVLAIEKDRRLITILEEKFATTIQSGQLQIIEADILDFDFSLVENKQYKIVANIPYYITGAIIEQFLSTPHQPTSMTLLMQKEVAERIVAREGKESLLSVAVKVYGTPKYAGAIKRNLFSPAPNVDSAILHIADISKQRFENSEHEQNFFTVVKAGFAHKRKLVSSNLKSMIAQEQLQTCGVPEKSRAEELTVEQWLCLASK